MLCAACLWCQRQYACFRLEQIIFPVRHAVKIGPLALCLKCNVQADALRCWLLVAHHLHDRLD